MVNNRLASVKRRGTGLSSIANPRCETAIIQTSVYTRSMKWQKQFSSVFFIVTLLVGGCGSSSSEIPVTLVQPTGTDFFASSSLADIILIVSNVDANSTNILFPSTCTAANGVIVPSCGFSPTESEFRLNLELLPANANLTLTVRGRDSVGATLFEGTSASFVNASTTTGVTVNLL